MDYFKILFAILLLSLQVNTEVCKDGQYMSKSGICQPCVSNCAQCTQQYQCTMCKSGYSLGTTTVMVNGQSTTQNSCHDTSGFAALLVAWFVAYFGIAFLVICGPFICICCIAGCLGCFIVCVVNKKSDTHVYVQPNNAAPNYYA